MAFHPVHSYYSQLQQQPDAYFSQAASSTPVASNNTSTNTSTNISTTSPSSAFPYTEKLPSISLPYPVQSQIPQQPQQYPQQLPDYYYFQNQPFLSNHNLVHPQVHYDSTNTNTNTQPPNYQPLVPYTNYYASQSVHPSSKSSSFSSLASSSPNTHHVHYPVSPASLNDKSHDDDAKLPIEYSSIVSYTVSPSFKRRRRNNSSSTSPYSHQQPNIDYSCPQCDKKFQKPYNLKSHMKTHSTEKPFTCSMCPKSFARSHDKKRHEQLHAGNKNFKCEGVLKNGCKWGCGKKFARSDALSRHFRTETGWLCIRPLMEEAKKSESASSGGSSATSSAATAAAAAAVAGAADLDPRSGDYAHPNFD